MTPPAAKSKVPVKPVSSSQGAMGSPRLNIERVPLSDLHQDPANARTHGERNLDAIGDSLRSFGQVEPLVVQRGTGRVIGGNGRLAVMRREGQTHADVVYLDIDDHAATRLGIALNRTAELAEWNKETLASLLDGMGDADLLTTGFDADSLKDLLADLTPPEVVEDEAPAPLPDPVSKTGDLWEMGGHRLLCGDSTKGEDVGRLLNGAKPFIMVTDPPYGVEYDPEWRNEAAEKGSIGFAARRTGVVANDDRVDWTEAYKLFGGTVAYVWHAGRFAADLVVNLRDAGFEIRTQIIWKKPAFAISRGHYHWQHEPCWYSVRKGGGSSKWCGDHSQSTVWDISNRVDKNDNTNHGTQKPVECMARPIRNHGGKDDDVYEPFSGSGTTIIAAEQLGRKCYAIEIEPRYVDVAVRRWEKLTGKQATCNGQTFAQVAAERGVSIV